VRARVGLPDGIFDMGFFPTIPSSSNGVQAANTIHTFRKWVRRVLAFPLDLSILLPARSSRRAQQETGMKLYPTAFGIAFASGTLVFASPAIAQYGAAQKPSAPPTAEAPAAQAQQRKVKLSKQASKEIGELQTAVNAKDVANIPAKLAAAQAKAQTADDKFVIAQFQLKAALDSKNDAAIGQALEAMTLSGAPEGNAPEIFVNLGKINYNTKAFDKAAAAFERAIQLDPKNTEAITLLAESRNAQGRTAEAVSLIQKAIATQTATGAKAEESWYKRAVSFAYNAKLPNSPEVARQWVLAYPTQTNWRDAIRIYQSASNLEDSALLDSMRLAQATGALAGENDYFRFTNTLVTKGFPGEAKLVLEQGFASNSISKSRPTFSQLYATATTKSQGDRASLAGAATAALASPDSKKVITIADAYYGYGDYAKAAELYRAALGKSGVDKDLANLRLGMSLARSGDKAGATAALNAAGGAQSEIAKFWLAYLATTA
jgi:tetratricopeptide (TPR) repeat protein